MAANCSIQLPGSSRPFSCPRGLPSTGLSGAAAEAPCVVLLYSAASVGALEATVGQVISSLSRRNGGGAVLASAQHWQLQPDGADGSFSFLSAQAQSKEESTDGAQVFCGSDVMQLLAESGCMCKDSNAAAAGGSLLLLEGQTADRCSVLLVAMPGSSLDGSSGQKKGLMTATKVLQAAGVESSLLPAWAVEHPLQLPAGIEQRLAAAAPAGVQLVLLLPPATDESALQAAACMLQLAGAVSGRPAAGGSPGPLAAAGMPRNPLADQLNRQVAALQAELDSTHAHYQQLLDRLLPSWQCDASALEFGGPAAAATAASSAGGAGRQPEAASQSSSSADASGQQQQQQLPLPTASRPAPVSADTGTSTCPAPMQAAQPAGRSRAGGGGGASLLLLESQLEAARKELRLTRERLSVLEFELTGCRERGAAREAALTAELRRSSSKAAAGAAEAADRTAELTAQVHQLQDELARLKSSHSAQLAAAQQQLVQLTERLDLQVNRGRQGPAAAGLVADAAVKDRGSDLKEQQQQQQIASRTQQLQHQQQWQQQQPQPAGRQERPPSPSTAAGGKPWEPQPAASTSSRPGSAVHRSGSKQRPASARCQPWLVSGKASCQKLAHATDLPLAGALLGSANSNVSRPASAAAAVRGGSTWHQGQQWSGDGRHKPAEIARLRRQVQQELQQELQQKAAAALAAAKAATADEGGSCPADNDVLAQFASTLQEQLQSCRGELAAERRRASGLALSLSSLERMQAEASRSFVATAAQRDSPSHGSAVRVISSRPTSPAAAAARLHQGLVLQQQWATGSRPCSALGFAAEVPAGGRRQR